MPSLDRAALSDSRGLRVLPSRRRRGRFAPWQTLPRAEDQSDQTLDEWSESVHRRSSFLTQLARHYLIQPRWHLAPVGTDTRAAATVIPLGCRRDGLAMIT